MSMSPCRTCGHQVATSARSCPQCGDRRPHAAPATGDAVISGERPEWLTLLLALVAAGIVISILAALWK